MYYIPIGKNLCAYTKLKFYKHTMEYLLIKLECLLRKLYGFVWHQTKNLL